MNQEIFISKKVKEAVTELYGASAEGLSIQMQATRKEFEGDVTAVMFPLLKVSRSSTTSLAVA